MKITKIAFCKLHDYNAIIIEYFYKRMTTYVQVNKNKSKNIDREDFG